MADLPDRFYVHRVTVTPLIGAGAYGDVFGDPIELPALIEEKRRIIRDANGVVATSEATFKCATAHAGVLTPNSLVTLHTEADEAAVRLESRILSLALRTDGGMGAWQHVEAVV